MTVLLQFIVKVIVATMRKLFLYYYSFRIPVRKKINKSCLISQMGQAFRFYRGFGHLSAWPGWKTSLNQLRTGKLGWFKVFFFCVWEKDYVTTLWENKTLAPQEASGSIGKLFQRMNLLKTSTAGRNGCERTCINAGGLGGNVYACLSCRPANVSAKCAGTHGYACIYHCVQACVCVCVLCNWEFLCHYASPQTFWHLDFDNSIQSLKIINKYRIQS